MFRPCTELPSESTPLGDNCLDTLTQKYTFVSTIGSGAAGTTVLLQHNAQELVVKLSPLNKMSVGDVAISCQVNSLRPKTGIFVPTFGWLVCSAPRVRRWPKMRGNKILYIFMDHAGYEWRKESIQLSQQEHKALLFLLLHGFYVARRDLQFSHNDLHAENVLLKAIRPDFQLVLDGGFVIAPGTTPFIPQVIDFGQSKTASYPGGKEEEEDSDSGSDDDMFERAPSSSSSSSSASDDLRQIEYLFLYERHDGGFLQPFFDSTAYSKAKADGSADSIYALLQDPIFNEVVTKQPQIPRVVDRCLVCSDVATHKWENKAGYVFCSDACSDSLSSISSFIS